VHALLRELLAVMPADGAPWPRADRERWTAAIAAVLDVVYDDDGRPLDVPASEGVVDLRPGDAPAREVRGRHARRGGD
jgi:hypothetical protein